MTMTKQKALDKARDGLKKGIYKTVRLVKIEEGTTIPIISWSKVSSEEALNRLEFIKYKIDGDLEAGVYEIQCKINFNKGGITEPYRFEIKERKTIPLSTLPKEQVEEVQTEEEPDMKQIDFDDYINTIRENAELKAQNDVLVRERDFYKKLSEEKAPLALNDSPEEKSIGERVIEGLAATAPSLLALADKFLEQRDRKLTLEENQQRPKLPYREMNKRIRRRVVQPMQDESMDREKLLEHMTFLCDNDEERFNDEMDALELSDPDTYDYIYDQLGLEDSEEE